VYSWDITKLAGPARGSYYDAYVMIDIYSAYIVGAHVHAREHGLLAEELMKEIFGIHGIPTVVHADRGTSMTSKAVATLLADLAVTRSHSRPRVSNDNPYSESLFKTMKYLPVFPERFGSLTDARSFRDRFTHAYNHEHHHTGIGLHTPADVHYGHASTVAEQRSAALAAARLAHPERFTTDADPKILALPEDAWINRPADPAETPATSHPPVSTSLTNTGSRYSGPGTRREPGPVPRVDPHCRCLPERLTRVAWHSRPSRSTTTGDDDDTP
jgi:hypothetical protein